MKRQRQLWYISTHIENGSLTLAAQDTSLGINSVGPVPVSRTWSLVDIEQALQVPSSILLITNSILILPTRTG